MSKATTCIAFTGPALEEGAIDVRDLAPSLLAFADLCQESHRALTGEKEGVAVRVRADFHAGSFEVVLEVIEILEIIGKLKDLWGEHIGAKELLGMIVGAGGLFAIIKKARGGDPKIALEEISKQGKKHSEFEYIRKSKLLGDIHVRKCVREFTRSINKDGIDGIEIRDKPRGEVIEEITKDDAPYFDVPDDGNIEESEQDIYANIITPQLEENRKWRFSVGEGDYFTATMEDADFIKKIRAGTIRFGQGDIIHVKRKTRQWTVDHKVKTEHAIVKVLKHTPKLS